MSRRLVLPRAVLAGGLTLVLAACGSGTATSTTNATTPTTTVVTSTTNSPATTSTTVPRSTTTPKPITSTTRFEGTIVEVTVVDSRAVGEGRVTVAMGSQVRLVITSDTADEIHVHGYDLTAPVTPDAPGQLEFTVDIPGVFEVELEESGVHLVDLEVTP